MFLIFIRSLERCHRFIKADRRMKELAKPVAVIPVSPSVSPALEIPSEAPVALKIIPGSPSVSQNPDKAQTPSLPSPVIRSDNLKRLLALVPVVE